MTYSVGIDMGGTFTDGYFSDGERAVAAKVPTTHFDLTRSVTACLFEGAGAFGVSLEDFLAGVGLFRLATTIGTNAVVTGTGDSVGLMVEAGAEKSLYGPSEPAPAVGVFVRADHVVGVDPTAAAEEVLGLCRDLVHQGVRQTVVSLRRPHRNVELGLRELVRDRYPVHYLRSMPLTLGWEAADVDDDELRTSTAVLNAYLSRPMAKLLYRTEGVLQQAGLSVPLLAARSDGTCSRMPRTTAISTYNSGPAAGLGLAASAARAYGDAAAVGFDMGGTTLDLGLVRDGAYEVDPAPEIRGVRVLLPVPGIVSVGLGGSSIASATDADRVSGVDGTQPASASVSASRGLDVTVGPTSAGAIPGPAAFGRGGTKPTLTDADTLLRFLADGQELPGDIVLDADRAAAALAPLAGGDVVQAALRVRAAAHSKAAAAVGNLLAEAGIDPAEATLYAFGGAGGLHAGGVAERAGVRRIRSFAHGGVFSARGVAGAPVRQRYESAVEPHEDPAEVLGRLLGRTRLDLEAERLPMDEALVTVNLHDASGRCQSFALQAGQDPASAAPGLIDSYSGTGPIARLEATTVVEAAAVAVGSGQAPTANSVVDASSNRLSQQSGAVRRVCWSSEPRATAIIQLGDMDHRETIQGPALVECQGAVHAIPPGWTCRRAGADSLLWERL